MWPYWLLFLVPSLVALEARPRYGRPRRLYDDFGWLFVILALTLVIGLRYKVGGDWYAYERHYRWAEAFMTPFSAVTRSEPGYWLLNVLSARLGAGTAGVNLVSGLIFATGLAVFCRHQPRPWLALAVAVPYMVIVVSMGFARQGVALGLAMIGLVALSRQSFVRFILWVVLAATFHKSAVLLIPIAALTVTRNRYLVITLVAVTAGLSYVLLLGDEVDRLLTNYVDAQYQSSGALIRLAMNAVPAVAFLMFRKRLNLPPGQGRIIMVLALISLALFAGFFVTSATTALDRLALYCIPLQLMVFSHAPDIIARRGRRNFFPVLMVVGYYALVLFVWLFFADNSRAWLPYRTIL